jgi:hypothetical protein
MGRPFDLMINWRAELTSLSSFLDSGGGVVHVVAGSQAPTSTFAKVLRGASSAFGDEGWLSVQLDCANPRTHYLADIVVQLERSLGLTGTPRRADGSRIVVGSNITAQTVRIENVTIEGDEDSFADIDRIVERCDRVAAVIRDRLPQQRFCLILLNSHAYDARTLNELRNLLWDPSLDDLTAAGLVMVDISDPSCQPSDAWPPPADLVLELTETYVGEARSHAEEDLAGIAVREGATATEADGRVFAKTLLAGFPTTRELYAQVSGTLRRMAAQADPK